LSAAAADVAAARRDRRKAQCLLPNEIVDADVTKLSRD